MITQTSRPLAGRVAVVTGAGRGIGRALAFALAEAGAAVTVSARTGADVDLVVTRIRAGGGSAEAVVADATDNDGASEPVAAAYATFGRVDILVNNVGGRVEGDHSPFDGDLDLVEAELRLNLLSAWWATRAALPLMRERESGRIINIGSGASRHSGSRIGYTIAKHGIVGLTRSVAAPAAAHGITVNCICPGWTDTHDWNAVARAAGREPQEYLRQARAQNLQGRIVAPEELGPMAVLLASDAGGAITGQVIGVDGGHKV